MAKGYWICCYRSISNPAAVAEYVKLAGPALQAAGGRFLVRGLPAKTHEAGIADRAVVIEFDSLQAALAAHESDAYQKALRVIQGGAGRDLRIIEGV